MKYDLLYNSSFLTYKHNNYHVRNNESSIVEFYLEGCILQELAK